MECEISGIFQKGILALIFRAGFSTKCQESMATMIVNGADTKNNTCQTRISSKR